MSKFLKIQIALALLSFVIAFIDSVMNDATGWVGLSFVGKAFVVIFLIILAYQVIRVVVNVVLWFHDNP